MGNANTPKEINNQYNELAIEESELLSHLIIVEDKVSKEKFMIRQINLANQMEYNKLLKDMKHRKMLSLKKAGKYIIQLSHFQTKEFSQICGRNFKLLLYLQHLQTSLKAIYNEKCLKKEYFSQQQIINIIKSVVNGLIVLHDNNYKNIHLYKETIFLTKDNVYKIVDNQLSHRIHPYYEILNNVPTKVGTYLAPELLKELAKENNDFYHSPKADIFTLAVIVLELCTMENYDSYYDYENKHMNIKGLRKVIDTIQYSGKLKSMLLMMLMEEEQQRMGLISLKQMVSSQDELYSYKSMSQNGVELKTVRLFGSRSRQDKITTINNSKHNSQKKIEAESRPNTNKENSLRNNNTYRPYSQYSTKEVNSSQQSVREEQMNQKIVYNEPVSYRPIEFPIKQPLQFKNIPPLIEVKDTPRAFYINKNTYQPYWIKQFETPVNILTQAPPEQTPIRKFQELNSMYNNQGHHNLILEEQQRRLSSLKKEFLNNKTYGKHQFNNGARYEGQMNESSEFDGNGILYYPNGEICYSGSWKNNAFHGFGVLNNENTIHSEPVDYQSFDLSDIQCWKYYEGQFNYDKKDGFGTLYLLNGDKFSGCFKQDSIQGFGTYLIARQNRNVNGIWANSSLKK